MKAGDAVMYLENTLPDGIARWDIKPFAKPSKQG